MQVEKLPMPTGETDESDPLSIDRPTMDNSPYQLPASEPLIDQPMQHRAPGYETDAHKYDYANESQITASGQSECSETERYSLFEAHTGLAAKLAKSFSGKGIEVDDLRQTALMALFECTARYDKQAYGEDSFSAFAAATIIGSLKRLFRDSAWSVRPPRSVQELSVEINRCFSGLCQKLGREPTRAEIALELGVDKEAIVEAMSANMNYCSASLDGHSREGDSGSAELMSDYDFTLSVEVNQLIAKLDPRMGSIFRLYCEGYTQAEIARKYGVSQMQVSRILRQTRELLAVELENY